MGNVDRGLVLCLVSALVLSSSSATRDNRQPLSPRRNKAAPLTRRPNIILMLTDDQDVELGSLDYMPKTRRLLRDSGAEFRHAYVTTPMCCPSRSSLLTGLYVHNHQVYTNNDNCSSSTWQATHEMRTFATYLSNAGYRTAYFGKYLNKYDGSYIPAGWREWCALVMNSRFYNYTLNVNGRRVKHGFDYSTDYYPDLIANDSVAFLRRSKHLFARKPVAMVLSFPSPHGPEDAAPQHADKFFNVTSHHTPSYDYAPNPDKQWILRATEKMEPIHRKFTDMLMTRRLQTLQSVDDAVEKIVGELSALGELDNTYIFYTSDHGYHLGQFGLVKGKSMPFEFDVRVPFLVRGPSVMPGSTIKHVALNIDLAPTFLAIAGVSTPAHMDGRSLLPLLSKSENATAKWPESFLIESSGRREYKSALPASFEGDGDGEEFSMPPQCRQKAWRTPCNSPVQKWECYQDGDGRWRVQKCKWLHGASRWNSNNKCVCPTSPTVVGTKSYAPLDQEERRKQREFLREHLNKDLREYQPKFLRTLRNKREALLETELERLEMINATTVAPPVFHRYSDAREWRARKETIDAEIRRLKIALELLREERKLLRETRPSDIRADDLDHDDEDDLLASIIDVSTEDTFRVTSQSTMSSSPSTVSTQTTSTTLATVDATCHCPEMDSASSTTTDGNPVVKSSNWLSRHLAREAEKAARRESRRRLKDERMRRKERRLRRKGRLLGQHCNAERMNCFSHDNDHWRTPPYWTDGPFCFCMNANNNTYSCIRTVRVLQDNTDENTLYCEFITGTILYFDLNSDPYELHNIAHTMTLERRDELHGRLERLKACRGSEDCSLLASSTAASLAHNTEPDGDYRLLPSTSKHDAKQNSRRKHRVHF